MTALLTGFMVGALIGFTCLWLFEEVIIAWMDYIADKTGRWAKRFGPPR